MDFTNIKLGFDNSYIVNRHSLNRGAAYEALNMGRMHTVVEVRAKPEEVFVFMDDIRHIEYHINKMGGKLSLEVLSR